MVGDLWISSISSIPRFLLHYYQFHKRRLVEAKAISNFQIQLILSILYFSLNSLIFLEAQVTSTRCDSKASTDCQLVGWLE